MHLSYWPDSIVINSLRVIIWVWPTEKQKSSLLFTLFLKPVGWDEAAKDIEPSFSTFHVSVQPFHFKISFHILKALWENTCLIVLFIILESLRALKTPFTPLHHLSEPAWVQTPWSSEEGAGRSCHICLSRVC